MDSQEDGASVERLSIKDKLDDKDCPSKGSLVIEDLNHNSLKLQECNEHSLANKGNKETDSEKQGRYKDHDEKHPGLQKREKVKVPREKCEKPIASKEKNCDQSSRKSAEHDTLPGSQISDDARQKKARPDSKDSMKSSSDRGRLKDNNRALSPESSQPKTLKVTNIKDNRLSGTLVSTEARNGKRKRPSEQDDVALKINREAEEKKLSKIKMSKSKHVANQSKPEEHSLSFESYLNYDVNATKRKVKSAAKPPKNTTGKETAKDPEMEADRVKETTCISEKQVSCTMTQKISCEWTDVD